MSRILVALSIALFASTAGAAVEPYNDFGATRADSAQECPAGTNNVSANYEWQNGRLVRNGWVCQTIHPRS
jgi:hypothetical protein